MFAEKSGIFMLYVAGFPSAGQNDVSRGLAAMFLTRLHMQPIRFETEVAVINLCRNVELLLRETAPGIRVDGRKGLLPMLVKQGLIIKVDDLFGTRIDNRRGSWTTSRDQDRQRDTQKAHATLDFHPYFLRDHSG